ncbi:hypothetical protein [Chitinophaga solisilvae]|uniref:FAS1 domain-containing protein n=1 Tax=Chitinophaga solisilvae TaxID=1233460 RepID=A0A9Q5GV80_9BACT|nr:hypothetical protein [Chitinophaga solisilvae]NSL90891.1 hypothetical protein [Chitinophaga solisilvae]
MKKNIAFTAAVLMTAVIALFTSCRKTNYYLDGGLSGQSEAEKNLSVYDFLASRSNHMFDSLIKIIDLTNSKALVNQQNITFFAVPNKGVRRLQLNYVPDDKQAPRALEAISKDTLLMLLNRFIIPGNRISLEQAVKDKRRFYRAANGDSLYIVGTDGGIKPGESTIQTSAFTIEFEHVKIPGTDTVKYVGKMQTHNLITANAMIHVLNESSSFGAGLKQRYNR